MRLTFGSLFAGIGGFDKGFEQAGMRCVWQVENDKYCHAVLQRHFPFVERRGDIVGLEIAQLDPVDVICGGFPCQDVSIAGTRKGLAGERSGLWSEFHRILEGLRPSWVVVENVTGLLSSNKGRDFATILQALAHLGYGVAWRVLDAQYFGVPQRRRRVFVVGHLGDGRAAEVLFESESGAWNPPPRRKKRPELAFDVAASLRSRRGGGFKLDNEHGLAIGFSMASHPLGTVELAEPITRRHGDPGCVARPVTTSGGKRWDDTSETYVAKPLMGKQGYRGNAEDETFIAIAENQRGEVRTTPTTGAVSGGGGKPGQGYQATLTKYGVRRLMPIECERLQGFPDDWTGGQSDSRRYKQLGNAVCVPVAAWIARRIVDNQ